MASVPAVNCAVATVQGVNNFRPVSFGLNFHFSAGPYAQSDIEALAEEVDAWVGANALNLICNEAAYTNTHVRGLTNNLDLEADNATNAAPGNQLGETMPNNVSFVVSHRTGLTGRSGRGRTYLWGLATVSLSANEDVFLTTFADQAVDEFEALDSFVAPIGWEHVVLSRHSGGVPRATALIIPVTQYVYTDLKVDTRRKRLG